MALNSLSSRRAYYPVADLLHTHANNHSALCLSYLSWLSWKFLVHWRTKGQEVQILASVSPHILVFDEIHVWNVDRKGMT